MRRLSNKAKFAIVGASLLLLAGIIWLTLALCLHWDIAGALTSTVAIIIYVVIGLLGITVGAYFICKKIKGRD